MEQPSTKLEAELAVIKAELAAIKSLYATKADLAQAKAEIGSKMAELDLEINKKYIRWLDDFNARKTRLVTLKTELNQPMARFNAGMAALQADVRIQLAEAKSAIIFWLIFTTILAQFIPALLKQLSIQG